MIRRTASDLGGPILPTVAFAAEVDQLWAEAVVLYREMRRKQPSGTLPLYLSDEEAREVAENLQESRRQETEVDILASQIGAWLDKPIDDGGFDDAEAVAEPRLRNETCVAEIWVECLGNELGKLNRQASLSLANALKAVSGWDAVGSITTAKYGKQRCFYRGGRKARMGI